jgi:hypothetical protein
MESGVVFPVVLASAFGPDQVARLTEIVRMLIPKNLEDGDINSYDMMKSLTAYGELGRSLMEETFQIFLNSTCPQVAHRLLRDTPVILFPHCAFRFHQPGDDHSHLPYHFDGGFMGTDVTTLNFWIPLVDVGETAPGITFLKPKVDPTPFLKDWLTEVTRKSGKRYSAEEIGRLYGQEPSDLLHTPVLQAGSVAVFHQLTPHATQKLPDGGDYRISIEVRVGGRSALPAIYKHRNLPFALPRSEAGRWVLNSADAQSPNELRSVPLAA